MSKFEIHTITQCDEDLGVLVFEGGELAVYDDRKTAQRVVDGMNYMRKTRGCGLARHEYIVVKTEVSNYA